MSYNHEQVQQDIKRLTKKWLISWTQYERFIPRAARHRTIDLLHESFWAFKAAADYNHTTMLRLEDRRQTLLNEGSSEAKIHADGIDIVWRRKIQIGIRREGALFIVTSSLSAEIVARLLDVFEKMDRLLKTQVKFLDAYGLPEDDDSIQDVREGNDLLSS
jgi:hypothetical protein